MNTIIKNWQKLILVCLLAICTYIFNQIGFKSIDFIVRDSLQFLNFGGKIDKSLVTLNMNIYSNDLKYPFELDDLKRVIEKVYSYSPRQIFLLVEPQDLTNDPNNRREIFKYLKSKKIYINKNEAGYGHEAASFSRDELFKTYPYLLNYFLCKDNNRYSTRRALLEYNLTGQDELDYSLHELGISTIQTSHFKYFYELWNTKQIYTKTYPVGSFNNIDSKELLEGKATKAEFSDKIVLIGHHDEFSFLGTPNIFNVLGYEFRENIRAYMMPYNDVVANNINTRLTGEYIKYIPNFPTQLILFFILIVIIFINKKNLTKLYLFLSLVPAILMVQIVIYLFDSFYIDFSKSIAMLIFLQYLAVPIVMLLIFKEQEKQKLQEINDARIDAFLVVSEKVAHDIRSPLSAINLLLGKATFPNVEHNEIVKQSIKRIDETAESLLQKYKVQAKPSSYDELHIRSSIEKIVTEKKILNDKINYSIKIDTNTVVRGHSIELERIISNILDNSIFALQNRPNPTIEIGTVEINTDVCLSIKDNGVGIPDSILRLLGSEQVTTKQNFKGNGIGLLHAKRAVENMNGSFEIASIENNFTEVRIVLKKAT